MKVLQVNCTDLPGSFSGHSLNMELRKEGIDARQVVLEQYIERDSSVSRIEKDTVIHQILRWAEEKYSLSNLLYPYGQRFLESGEFLDADVVHYHILHRFAFSLFDYPALMKYKKVVWTIHDPWIVTGNCVHPLECEKWKTGCGGCDRLTENGFEMREDHTDLMWQIKYDVLRQINPHIVVASGFMEDYLRRSPITGHFDKIHRIPFGVKNEKYDLGRKSEIRQKFGIPEDKIVLGFRADDNPIKGCEYIYEALPFLEEKEKTVLVTVGDGTIPEGIKRAYRVLELGWLNDENLVADFMLMCDIFLMPSIAESFGYMALEAMAAQTPVISFEGTVVEEIIDTPRCGLSVTYRSSRALREAVDFLILHKDMREEMGREGRKRVEKEYLFREYVRKHRELYAEILKEDNIE